MWALHGLPQVVFTFTVEDGRVVGIDLVAERERLDAFNIRHLGR